MKYIKMFMAFILTMSLNVCAFNIYAIPDIKDKTYDIKETYDSVGMIAIRLPDGKIQGIGTAFGINKNELLTVAHVCSALEDMKIKKIWLVYLGRSDMLFKRLGVSIKRYDTKNDICKLRLWRHGLKPVKLGKYSKVNLGDKVYITGAPSGFMISITEGRVMNKLTDKGPDIVRNKLLVSAASTGGHSGSPVFNSKGELIGILSAGSRTYSHLSFSVPLPQILKFMRNK